MAWAVVQKAATNSWGGVRSHTTGTLASTPTSGNLLLFIMWTRDQSSACTYTWPSGATEAGRQFGSSDNFNVGIAYKIAGASESNSFSISYNIDSYTVGSLVIEISGVDTTTPIDAAPVMVDRTWAGSYTTSAVTTTVANSLHILGHHSVSQAATPPSGYTEQHDANGIWLATKEIASTGSTGTYSLSSLSGYAVVSFSLALKPAGGGGGAPIPVFMNHYRQMGIA